MRTKLLMAAAILSLTAGAAQAQDKIKIGVLATLEGALTTLGEDALRGMEVAMKQAGAKAGGKTIEVITFSTNASPDSAIRGARKLVEQDKVDILIGPVSGSEGIAIRDYSKTQPQVTVLNGSSGALETTYVTPSPNFFRFNMDGSQWLVGLGNYIYNEKKWRKIATVAEDYSFPYTQVFGFMTGFCKSGGHVVNKFWVPIGNKDFSSIVASIPDDIDAIYVALGGADAVNFLNQYEQAGGDKPMVGGSITVDQTVLGSQGKQRDFVIGTASAGPIADNWDNAAWKKFVADYKAAFPDGFPSPSLFAQGYYVSTLAMLDALDQVKGDLSGDQKAYRDALQNLKLDTPTGPVTLDKNRNGVAYNFLTEVAKGDDGHLYNKVVKVVENVNQTLGMPEDEFLKIGPVSRDNPSCP